MLTIFFDGNCPLCNAEMKSLKKHDNKNVIKLVDVHNTEFAKSYPEINMTDALKILHGQYQGELLLGLEVTHRAWTLVGKGFWVAPLNWPILKTLSHLLYLGIAKYRQPISSTLAKLFNLKTNCNSGVCFDKSTNTHHRRK
jgi:predicted DCC family thiol-disulfide oxidoreductase YuxK